MLALGAGGLGTAALLDTSEPTAAPVTTTASPPPPPVMLPPSPPSRPRSRPETASGVTIKLPLLPPPRPKLRPATTEAETTEPPPTTTTAAVTTTTPVTSPATKPKPKPKVVAPPKPKPKPKTKTTTTPEPTQPVVTSPPVTTTAPPPPPPDTTAPTVAIDSGPSTSTTSTTATFTFSASEAGVTFGCSLDGAPFTPCTSPRQYTGLAVGQHTFAVHATDAAGNTGPAAQHAWSVTQGLVLVLPDLVIESLSKYGVVVKNVGNGTAGPSTLTISLVNQTISVGSLPPGQSATANWSICRVGTLTARADRMNAVTESNESNNVVSLDNPTCP